VHGASAIYRIITNPIVSLKGLAGGSEQQSAAAIQLQAARMNLAAAEKRAGVSGVGGLSGAEEAGGGAAAGGFLARGRALLRGAGRLAGVLGVATTVADIAGNELGKTSWFRSLGVYPSNHKKMSPVGSLLAHVANTAASRVLNVADTVGNIFTGGMWHPHLNAVATTSQADKLAAAARWAGVARVNVLSGAQQQTLLNYWNSGASKLSGAQGRVLRSVDSLGMTSAQHSQLQGLDNLAAEVQKLGSSHESAVKKQQDAAHLQSEAAVLLKQAADDFLLIPAKLAAALSPSNINKSANAGLRGAVARV
jgi:hypothetical protein